MIQIDASGIAFADLHVDPALVRRYFESGHAPSELRNPHPEAPVPDAVRRSAKPAAVLIPLVDYPASPALLVTRRHRNIRFAGHICFPGGRVDPHDATEIDTALRETQEEIGLAPQAVEVLGCLGEYYTQAGYRIAPVVGVIRPPFTVKANPKEVEEIIEIPLVEAFRARNYRLTWHRSDRGHIALEHSGVRIAGPTISLLIGLYERLAAFTGLAYAGSTHPEGEP